MCGCCVVVCSSDILLQFPLLCRKLSDQRGPAEKILHFHHQTWDSETQWDYTTSQQQSSALCELLKFLRTLVCNYKSELADTISNWKIFITKLKTSQTSFCLLTIVTSNYYDVKLKSSALKVIESHCGLRHSFERGFVIPVIVLENILFSHQQSETSNTGSQCHCLSPCKSFKDIRM